MSRAIQALILGAQRHPWQHDPWTCHIPRDVVAFPRETQQAQGGLLHTFIVLGGGRSARKGTSPASHRVGNIWESHPSSGQLGQPHLVVGPVEDDVIFSDKDISQDPELALLRGHIHALQSQSAVPITLLQGQGMGWSPAVGSLPVSPQTHSQWDAHP